MPSRTMACSLPEACRPVAVGSETVSDTDTPGDGQALDDGEEDLEDGGDDEAEERAREDLEEGVRGADAGDPVDEQDAEPGSLDDGADHGDRDRDQRGDPDAVEDDRPRQRELDGEQAPHPAVPEAAGRL